MRTSRRRMALACILAMSVSVGMPSPSSAAGTEPGAALPAPTVVYIESVYDLFLGRAPTPRETDAWSPIVHRGDRGILTSALAASDEWAGARVDDLYRTALDRPADQAGRAHWVEAIRDGLHLEAVAARFYGSQEYFGRAGGSSSTFVGRLYEDVLGRGPDAAGRDHWVGRLEDGSQSRIGVAAAFYASVESRRDRVADRYQEVLGREPDAEGRRHWMARLLHIGDVELAASLAASDEQYRRATGLPAPSLRVVPVGPGTAYPLESSWRPGCPVHHRDLVAVEFPHLRDDGSIADGVLIVHRTVAGDVARAVRALYGSGFPLTSALPVDAFGGDDVSSMEADNSSAFNCRVVAGTTTWSEHSYGRAVDLNPRRNPYVSGDGVQPPSGSHWLDRADVRPGMIVAHGPVVEVFDALGWGWGGRWTSAKDYQHFSTTGR